MGFCAHHQTAGAVEERRHLDDSSVLNPATRQGGKYKMGALPPGNSKYASVEKTKPIPRSHLGKKTM